MRFLERAPEAPFVLSLSKDVFANQGMLANGSLANASCYGAVLRQAQDERDFVYNIYNHEDRQQNVLLSPQSSP